MAEPLRAPPLAPHLAGRPVSDCRGALLRRRRRRCCFEARRAAFDAAGAELDVVGVTGALEIPAGIAIALDAGERRRAAPTMAPSRSAASFAAKPFISRSSPASPRAR